ncbi:(Fe-S)-binding protein [Chondromyces crocatus]|uniref:Fe-S oxidoreductase n=1 Tax=Chondromyces crocatus TaxID=52 RepID=A0A0K1E712_CHOCO|nr:(Fe-S)-binding protein [Chondromyces crocatus]AKT36650.1 Fe-S oxidoreductase [Chondromyces crocatus]
MRELRLPLLESSQAQLEKCVYCPKLCRATCPVSEVEASETVTPWGKMSMAYFAARGDVPVDVEHAAPAWACSNCYACTVRCNHRNDVSGVLTDARTELFERGAAPLAAQRVAREFAAHTATLSRAVDTLVRDTPRARDSGGVRTRDGARSVQVLIGCGYVRHAPDVARDALDAVEALTGAPTRAVRACCGLPLLYAGDQRGFAEAARRLAAEVQTVDGSGNHDAGSQQVPALVVVDPGCARSLLVEYPRLGVKLPAPALFVDLVSGALDRLSQSVSDRRLRYHDPCQLGRGLNRYDQPRAILARVSGRPPEEFAYRRERAECSGAGGLLPATRPETSAGIAERRLEEHRSLGGGLLVTHCAQSLRRFRSRGEPAEDLITLVADAIKPA